MYQTYIQRLVALATIVTSLNATSPIINRYFPYLEHDANSLVTGRSAQLSVTSSMAHISKTFSQVNDDRALHREDGLLELDGKYDLKAIAYSAATALPNYTLPFFQETGGHAWLDRELVFSARSSVSMYAATIRAQLPLWQHGMCGVSVPLMHIEARQRYDFPANPTTQYSYADGEQVRRLGRRLHSDIGLKSGDWQVDGLGDMTVWGEYQRTASYWGPLRTASLSGRVSLGIPTGRHRSERFAASVPFGGNGHWGLGLTVQPAAEVKENIFFQVPLTVAWQAPRSLVTRIPVYDEPAIFSALKGAVRIKPGLSLRLDPKLTFSHVMGIDNLHCSVTFAYTRHFADTWEDIRTENMISSYLTRDTLPVTTATMAQKYINDRIAEVEQKKKDSSKWSSAYLVWDALYELRDVFPTAKHAPVLRATYEHCITGYRAGRTNQLSVQVGWRF